ncbi:MAG: alpha/beta fold hydrolase [Acidobacteria bacterium]|nr:alpha/beta fold hydrolase [Acidobacteriota bacterium]
MSHQPSSAALPTTERFLESDDPARTRLALSWTPGTDPRAPVWIFLHGLGSDRKGAKALRIRDHLFGRGPGFVALDFTGHGDSGGDCHGLSLARNLDDIGRAVSFVREEAPAATPILVGSSMGGIAALWYAALNPGAIHRVFAIAPAFLMAARFTASLSSAARRDWGDRGFLSVAIGDRDLEIGWGMVTDEDAYPMERLAADLRTPSLLIHGDADAVVPPQLSREFAGSCSAADLVEIEGGDHRLTDRKDLLFEIMWTAASNEVRPPA